MSAPQVTFLNARAIVEKTADGKKMVLIQRRLDNGTYEFPGGRIEPGETVLDALKREVREETGLTVTKIHGIDSRLLHEEGVGVETVVPFSAYQCVNCWQAPDGSGHKSVGFHFVCEADGELLEAGDGSDSIQWVTLEKLQELLDIPEKFGCGIDMGAAKIYLSKQI